MAQPNKYTSGKIEYLEPFAPSVESTAPAVRPQPQKAPLRLVEKPKKSKAELEHERLVAQKKSIKIIAVACAVLTLMAMVIYSRIQLDEINREIAKVENEIKVVKSDTVRLNNELNSVVSIDKVENYALNNLGMVKVQDYQVVYVDLSGEDAVVMADGNNTADVINNENK